MKTAQENFNDEIRWHVVSVNSRMEIETANRINESGFVAHCPTWIKKIRRMNRSAGFLRSVNVPLFASYFFVQEDDAFRSDKFETTKVKLIVFRKQLLTDAQMTVINCTANDLTLAQSRTAVPLKIKKGAVMRVLYGAMAGKSVKALQDMRGELIEVEPEEYPGRSVKVKVDSLARAV